MVEPTPRSRRENPRGPDLERNAIGHGQRWSETEDKTKIETDSCGHGVLGRILIYGVSDGGTPRRTKELEPAHIYVAFEPVKD